MVDLFGALDALVLAGRVLGAVELPGQRAAQDVVHERALAAAAHARDARQAAEREGGVDVLQVVLRRADDLQPDRVVVASAGGTPVFCPSASVRRRGERLVAAARHGDRQPAGEVLRGGRVLHAQDFLQRALRDEPPAARTRAGADVEDVVGGADRVLVVLDDDDAVAQVAQAAQGGDEPVVVALVQADAGFVEHVEHARQPRADLRGEADALRFAAGKRAALAVEVEVVQADFHEEPQPRGNLAHDLGGDLALGGGEFQSADDRVRLADGQTAELADVERARAVRAVHAQRDRQNFRPQPRAVAGRAGLRTHERLEPVFGQFALGGVEQVLELGDQPVERLLGPWPLGFSLPSASLP